MFERLKGKMEDWLRHRVIGRLYEFASATVRHGVGLAGMWLMANADATAAQVETIEGGALVAFSLLWSYARKLIDKKRAGS